MPYLPGMPEHEPNVEYNDFWEGCKTGELLIKKCKDCGWYIHYPRPLCPKCYSWNLEWSKVSGKGKVWTWTIVTEPIDPVVEGKVPYNVVEVELDEQEGLRLVSNLIDCKPEDITMGMPVEVVFDEMSPELTLPRFKKAS